MGGLMDLLSILAKDGDLWSTGIEKSELKGLSKNKIMYYSDPHYRANLINAIANSEIDFGMPHMALIEKDTPGEFREVLIETDDGRIVLSIINDLLFKVFGKKFVHRSCVSYQKGISTGKVVTECSKVLTSLPNKIGGIKIDFYHYFDNVLKEKVFALLDDLEDELKMERGTDKVINLIRRIYSKDWYLDLDGHIQNQWRGIRQGNPLASFFADAILYELDEYMTNNYDYYCRYSDDCVILSKVKTKDEIIKDVNNILNKYGIKINDKKTEVISKNTYFKFLGFNIKGSNITLSKGALYKFRHEVIIRTKGNYKISYKQSLKKVMDYLYGDLKSDKNYSWSSIYLRYINVESDIHELNYFIMDCLRAVKLNRRHISKPGYEPNKVLNINGKKSIRDGVVTYSIKSGGAPGKNVKSNIERGGKIIDGYITLMDAKNCLSYSKEVLYAKRMQGCI